MDSKETKVFRGFGRLSETPQNLIVDEVERVLNILLTDEIPQYHEKIETPLEGILSTVSRNIMSRDIKTEASTPLLETTSRLLTLSWAIEQKGNSGFLNGIKEILEVMEGALAGEQLELFLRYSGIFDALRKNGEIFTHGDAEDKFKDPRVLDQFMRKVLLGYIYG